MSAENIIDSYLKSDYPVTFESLQIYVEEAVSVKPLLAIVRFISLLKDKASMLQLFSSNKDMIKSISNKTFNIVDDSIFGEKPAPKEKITDIPVPKTEEAAESFLVKFHKYMSSKFKGLKLEDLKSLFKMAYGVVMKILIAAIPIGIGIVAAPAFIILSVISALIIVVLSVMNAVQQTKDIQDPTVQVDVKGAFKNVMSGFKKMFTSLKVGKKEGSFAIISTLLLTFMYFIKKYTWTIIKEFETWGTLIFRALQSKMNEPLLKIRKIFNEDPVAIELANVGKEKLLKHLKNTMTSKEAEKLATELVDKYANVNTLKRAGETGKSWGAAAGKAFTLVVIPIICVATIFYLFSELVDFFNLEKLRMQDSPEEDFEKIV